MLLLALQQSLVALTGPIDTGVAYESGGLRVVWSTKSQ